MPNRTQSGYLFKASGSWFLRFYDTFLVEGIPQRKQVARKLASCHEFRTRKSVQPLIAEMLSPINAGTHPIEGTMPLSQFVEEVYLVHVRNMMRPSTVRSYEDLWKKHLLPRCGTLRVRDFSTVDGERLLQAIARQTNLARTSLKHIKSLLSAIFTCARRKGLLLGVNPMSGVSIPKGTASKETYAYSITEVARMIAVLSEPAATIVAVAAFTGLRKGELRGLRWEDLHDSGIFVTQSVWNNHITEPKTRKSKAAIPVIAPLMLLLEKHRHNSEGVRSGLMFASASGRPLNLDNLALRTIRPTIQKVGLEWNGWHGFRRGLATTLYSLSVQDKVIQQILRHSNVSTTMNIYVKTVPADASDAMKVLEKVCGLTISKVPLVV